MEEADPEIISRTLALSRILDVRLLTSTFITHLTNPHTKKVYDDVAIGNSYVSLEGLLSQKCIYYVFEGTVGFCEV